MVNLVVDLVVNLVFDLAVDLVVHRVVKRIVRRGHYRGRGQMTGHDLKSTKLDDQTVTFVQSDCNKL